MKIGVGNISKRIGESITEEQLIEKIAARAVEILDTISQAKADKAVSLAGYGILDGLSFVEGYADEIDDYYSTDNAPKLYKIIQESRMLLMKGFVPYYLYAGTIHPLVDGKGTDLYQYKITSNGILFRKGNRNNNANTWASWGLLGSGSSGGAVSSVNRQTGDVVLDASDVGAISDELLPKVMLAPNKNDVYTKEETNAQISSAISSGVTPTLIKKAENDLSNVSNEDFLAKLNAVLPDGDEVSY